MKSTDLTLLRLSEGHKKANCYGCLCLTLDNMIQTFAIYCSDTRQRSNLNLLSITIGYLIGSPIEEMISIASGESCNRFIIYVTLALET
jgi:hypothetical protein